MEPFHDLVRYLHVAAGAIGLTAFWVPVFTRKGGPTHRRFGRIFKYSAWIVLGSAGLGVVLLATRLLLDGQTPVTRPVTFAMLVFLGYLALVTFIVVHHGTEVLRYKGRPAEQATRGNVLLARLSILASVVLVAYAFALAPPNRVLLYALSPIGILSGLGMLRYFRNPPRSSREWFFEHLGAMLGGGIAFHTAFAVFGATRLFDIGLEGWVAVIPWVAPAAIGIPATTLWQRHFRRRLAA